MKIRTRLFIFVLLSYVTAAHAQIISDSQDKPRVVEIGIGGGIFYPFVGSVSSSEASIPLSLRQVPGHPQDFLNPPRITIPGSVVDPGSVRAGIGYTLAPEIIVARRVVFRSGLNFSWLGLGSTEARRDSMGNTQEVNLQGTTERGFGRSLVYYAVLREGSKKPSLYYEGEVRVHGPVWILAGQKKANLHYSLERGYDRFNTLERLDIQRFATTTAKMTYIGVSFRGFDNSDYSATGGVMIFVGISKNSAKYLTPAYPDLHLPKKGWVFGAALSGAAVF